MKKSSRLILIAVVVMAAVTVASAYEAPPSPDGTSSGKFVIIVGPLLSNLSFSEAVGNDKTSRFGFAGGAGYEFPLGQSFSAQIALVFSTGGANFTSGNDTYSYVANALAIPVQFKYNFSGGFFVSAGPYIGLILSPKITYDIGGVTGENDISTSDINTFVYGLLLGGGFEMDLKGLTGFVQLAYNLGLSNINKNGSMSVKPNSINLIFGVKL